MSDKKYAGLNELLAEIWKSSLNDMALNETPIGKVARKILRMERAGVRDTPEYKAVSEPFMNAVMEGFILAEKSGNVFKDHDGAGIYNVTLPAVLVKKALKVKEPRTKKGRRPMGAPGAPATTPLPRKVG